MSQRCIIVISLFVYITILNEIFVKTSYNIVKYGGRTIKMIAMTFLNLSTKI